MGRGLREVADLDEVELEALIEAHNEVAQQRSWTADTELLAEILTQLRRVSARLDAGLPVVQVRKTRRPTDVAPVERPSFITEQIEPADGEQVITSPADFFRILKRT